MGQIKSRVNQKCAEVFNGEKGAEFKRGLSYFNERACIFKEVTLLTKSKLQDIVAELNEMLIKGGKASDHKVLFHCNIDDGLNWKAKSTIFCLQLDNEFQDPVVTRYISVIQFMTLRKDILQQVGKKYGKEDENEFQLVHVDGENIDIEQVQETPENNDEADRISASEVLERVNHISAEEFECCICMERKSDVSLSCAHCFCKECIDSWQRNEQKTCPMCRQAFSDQDEYWEMTDLPDKDEMHKYVVSLASGIPSVMMTS